MMPFISNQFEPDSEPDNVNDQEDCAERIMFRLCKHRFYTDLFDITFFSNAGLVPFFVFFQGRIQMRNIVTS